MVRGYILLSSIVFGVVFRLYKSYDVYPEDEVPRRGFWFTERTLDVHSFVYFQMEHVIALMYALCIINPKWLQDNTPTWILWWFFVILGLDLFHFNGWFRDESVGWNLAKFLLFAIPLTWTQIKSWNA